MRRNLDYDQTFYAVYARNAVGIFTSYERASYQRAYLKGFNCKYFKSKIDALEYALTGFNDLQEEEMVYVNDYDDFPVNWVVYKKDLLRGDLSYGKQY